MYLIEDSKEDEYQLGRAIIDIISNLDIPIDSSIIEDHEISEIGEVAFNVLGNYFSFCFNARDIEDDNEE